MKTQTSLSLWVDKRYQRESPNSTRDGKWKKRDVLVEQEP
jgi:hypothetical protein